MARQLYQTQLTETNKLPLSLIEDINTKQDTLIPGDKINIEGSTINVTGVYNRGEVDSAINDALDALSSVAHSGSYDDLTNKPVIPSRVSDLDNDANFITASYHDDTKQDKLTAGANITIVGNTISATGEGAAPVWGEISGALSQQADLKAVLDNKAEKDDVPSKLSELENDCDFITSNYHDSEKADKIVTYTKAEVDALLLEKADSEGVPTKLSQLVNDEHYITAGYHDSEKVDKEVGKSLISDDEIVRLASVDNYDDTDVKEAIDELNTKIVNARQIFVQSTMDIPSTAKDGDIILVYEE